MPEPGMICLWLLVVHNTLAGRFPECHNRAAKVGDEVMPYFMKEKVRVRSGVLELQFLL